MKKNEKTPHVVERLCVSCRQKKPKEELMRVAAFGGMVCPDPSGKAPGRGAYVCRHGLCLQQALREGRLARSLKQPIAPEQAQQLLDQWDEINARDLESRALHLVGLGKRGANLACGTQSVEIALNKGKALLVIQAKDAAENGAEAIRSRCESAGVPCYTLGTKEELGRLTGKDVRTVIAVLEEGLADGLRRLLESQSDAIV